MTIRWNTDVYTQERSIVRISGIDANASSIRVIISSSGLVGTVVKYSIPASKNLDIDFSDLVRLSATGICSITQNDASGEVIGSSYTIRWTQVGRINPQAYFQALPPDDMAETFELAISAPSVMYKRLDTNADPIVFEMANGGSGYQFAIGRVKFPPLTDEPIDFARNITVPNGAASVEFRRLNSVMYYRPLKELECGKRYAEVEWVSFTGLTRRHVFEVVKLTEEATNEISLETITNEYDVRKDRRVSFSLRLEGLSAYDYWYYSDLVTSSSVKVSLSGTSYRKVQVTAKKSTIPETSAGKPLTLEIPINYVRYDTL